LPSAAPSMAWSNTTTSALRFSRKRAAKGRYSIASRSSYTRRNACQRSSSARCLRRRSSNCWNRFCNLLGGDDSLVTLGTNTGLRSRGRNSASRSKRRTRRGADDPYAETQHQICRPVHRDRSPSTSRESTLNVPEVPYEDEPRFHGRDRPNPFIRRMRNLAKCTHRGNAGGLRGSRRDPLLLGRRNCAYGENLGSRCAPASRARDYSSLAAGDGLQ
jgi:hypothetical protein